MIKLLFNTHIKWPQLWENTIYNLLNISLELIHCLHVYKLGFITGRCSREGLYFYGIASLNMLASALENLIQQFWMSKPGGLLFSCKDDQQHQNISAMPGQQRAFGSVLRIDPQWGSLPSSVVSCLQGTEREVRREYLHDFPHGLPEIWMTQMDQIGFYPLGLGTRSS